MDRAVKKRSLLVWAMLVLGGAGFAAFQTLGAGGYFASPWPLRLLAGALLGIGAVLGVHTARKGVRGGRWEPVALVRVLVALGLALAAAGLRLPWGRSALFVVYVIDLSDSILDRRELDLAWRAAQAACPADALRAVVVFGRHPALERHAGDPTPLESLVDVRSVVDRSASDYGAALRLAGALFPRAGAEGRAVRLVVVLGDGRDTRGQALVSASALGASGARVYACPVEVMARSDVRVLRVTLPRRVPQGQEIPIDVEVAATGRAEVRVALERADETPVPNGEPKTLRFEGAETRRVRFRDRRERRGVVAYRAHLETVHGNAMHQNDVGLGAAYLVGPTRVLWVSGTGRQPERTVRLRQALAAAKILIDGPVLPTEVPRDAERLAPYGAIVLDDMPYRRGSEGAGVLALDADQYLALSTYVRLLGGGLLTLGGDQAYLLGGHLPDGPLEALLPVKMLPRDDRRNLFVIVLDASGSMNLLLNDRSKMEWAKAALENFAATGSEQSAISEQDLLALVAFSDRPFLVLPPTLAREQHKIREHLLRLGADGKTNIQAALQLAAEMMKDLKADRKIAVLISDGEPNVPGQSFAQHRQLCLKLKEQLENDPKLRAQIATIYIGQPAEVHPPAAKMIRFLRNLASQPEAAADAGEKLAAVGDASQLAPVLRQLALRTKKQFSYRRSPFVPRLSSNHPLGQDLTWEELPWRNRVAAKNRAEVVLDSGTELPDPVLAIGEYGAGKAAALMVPHDETGSTSAGTGLAALAAAPQLLARILRWLENGDREENWLADLEWRQGAEEEVEFTTEVRTRSGLPVTGVPLWAHVSAITRESGAIAAVPRPVELVPFAPGRYRARLPGMSRGLYRLEVRRGASLATELVADAFVSVPYSREYLALGADQAFLAEICHATGGRVVDSPPEIFAREGGQIEASRFEDARAGVLWAACVLFLLDLLLRAVRARARRKPAQSGYTH